MYQAEAWGGGGNGVHMPPVARVQGRQNGACKNFTSRVKNWSHARLHRRQTSSDSRRLVRTVGEGRAKPGLEIDNEKVENNSILDTSKKSSEFLHSITKIKSREYRSIDNVKSILFSDSVDNDSVNIF